MKLVASSMVADHQPIEELHFRFAAVLFDLQGESPALATTQISASDEPAGC